jgi:putative transposase
MMSLPTTYKETATVSPGKGFRLNYLYYWCDAFRDPLVEQTRVPVRYDPHDIGIAYAFVHKQWVRCISEHYRIFRGHSEQELLLAAAELQQRRRKMAMEGTITARRLAHFLKSVEAEELLLTQRLRDAAVRQSMDVIESDSDLTNSAGNIGQSILQEAQVEGTMSEMLTESSSESDWRELLPEY